MTKLHIPPLRSPLVPRSRLVERCQAGLGCNLVLVSAPAGFGKTTLLSQWLLRGRPQASGAWLSLDEMDNDPVRFWRYFIAAIRTSQPEAGATALELLASGGQVPVNSILTELINDLAGITADFCLVLDDYQFIGMPAIHEGISFLLEHIPSKVHLVISTRVDPPLPLARFRGRGLMLEITSDDLRFTPEEITGLLNSLDVPELSEGEINSLASRTGGWAAGLKMAMLTLRSRDDAVQFLSDFTGSQRYIMDYLLEEVLQRQPNEIREFLLETSVLDRLCGPLCDAVTGRKDGQNTLLKLEKENLFLVPLDSSRHWYRYEHLFRDLLRHQMETEYSTGAAAELQKKASRWYEGNGFMENAVNHALAASDWNRVMELAAAANVISAYGGLTAYRWLNPVPRDVLLTHGRASIIYAWSLVMTGLTAKAKEFLERLEQSAAYNDDFAGSIAAIRTYIAVATLDPATEQYAERALALLPQNAPTRATISFLLGLHYSNDGRYAEAEPLLTAACDFHRSIGDNASVCADLGMLAIVILTREADLHKMEKMLREAVSLAERHPNAALAYSHLGLVYYFWNQLDVALAWLEKALELHPGNMEILTATYFYTVMTRLAQGKIDDAEQLLEKAEELITSRHGNAKLQARVAGYHIAVATARDDLDSAHRWLEDFAHYEDVFVCDAPTDAMRLLHERWGPSFQEKLEAQLAQYRRDDLKFYLMPTLTEKALTTPEPEKAMECLAEALAIGKPYGYIRMFVNWGTSLAPLLKKAIKQGIEPDYARKLLHIIEEEDRQKQERKKGVVEPVPADILSERELEVLRLVADGASNPQIAARLSVSLATVKTHVHHIIDKLEVLDRGQAVYRARELKLLER